VDLHVRERTAFDLSACIEMAVAVHQLDGYPVYLPTDLRTFLDSPGAYDAWVVESRGVVVGHVALHRRSSDGVMAMASAALRQPQPKVAVIARLLVAPTARRLGVGKMLLDVARHHALDRGLWPILEVATKLLGAVDLYEHCCWVRAGAVTIALDNGTSLDEFVYLGPGTPDDGAAPPVVARSDRASLDDYLDAVLIGGREQRPIEIVDYRPQWAERFETERRRLEDALGSTGHRIEHVGSTAVPGLGAKPIVDIMVTVDDPNDELVYRSHLEDAGYLLRVREVDHRMFRTPGGDVHVHIWKADSDDEYRHLLFRDRLRSDADDRREYERVKRDLAGRHTDMNHYSEAKTAVIESIMTRAADSGFTGAG
jgi:GrpB-like predicted nucleotidyltransferase (UPF0157 family)/GNAT superfamily N-acetyltransferase